MTYADIDAGKASAKLPALTCPVRVYVKDTRIQIGQRLRLSAREYWRPFMADNLYGPTELDTTSSRSECVTLHAQLNNGKKRGDR